MRFHSTILFALISSGFVLGSNAFAHSAHVHGKASATVAVDGAKIQVNLSVPQDSLIGFERQPKTDAEWAKAAKALEVLAQGDRWVKFTAEGACELASRTIEASLMVKPIAGAVVTKAEHSDVLVSYRFECKKPAEVKLATFSLFDAFKDIKVIQVQLAGAKKQKSARLVSSARQIPLQ